MEKRSASQLIWVVGIISFLWFVTEGSIFVVYKLETVLKSWRMLPGPSCVEFLNVAAYFNPARRVSHLRKDSASLVRTLT